LYGYVLGDPVNFVDPEGEHPAVWALRILWALTFGNGLTDLGNSDFPTQSRPNQRPACELKEKPTNNNPKKKKRNALKSQKMKVSFIHDF